jgi:hypothetical protein
MGPSITAIDVTATDAAVERGAILDAARQPVSEELGKPVLFRVRTLNRQDGWAFLFAEMEERSGAPIDYAGTRKAEAAKQGVVSRSYVALLRKVGMRWTVIEAAIGPTDAVWEQWAVRHADAPATLFRMKPN